MCRPAEENRPGEAERHRRSRALRTTGAVVSIVQCSARPTPCRRPLRSPGECLPRSAWWQAVADRRDCHPGVRAGSACTGSSSRPIPHSVVPAVRRHPGSPARFSAGGGGAVGAGAGPDRKCCRRRRRSRPGSGGLGLRLAEPVAGPVLQCANSLPAGNHRPDGVVGGGSGAGPVTALTESPQTAS